MVLVERAPPFMCTLIFATLLALQCLGGFAASSQVSAEEAKKLHIVYLGERQHEDADLVTASHHDFLASVLGSKEAAAESIIYSYKHGFSGFSAMLTESHATKIRGLPGVVSVRINQMHNTHTTRSWDFMGLPYNQPNGLLANAKMGDDIIIGIIDSGIWPESLSFEDDRYGPPPPKWKGICQSGDSFGPKNCNGKIIGARWYADDVDKTQLSDEFLSPRDANGHGSHVASTAAGNLVHNVSLHGLAPGAARGGAPRARIAVYKACWGIWSGQLICSEAAIAKAIDDAIHDGVDVLSLSMAGPLFMPATLHAIAKGIPVVYSAGNSGPSAETVQNMAPWLLTVAATTTDRLFPTTITLGSGQKLVGQSLFTDVKEANRFHKLELYLNNMCNETQVNTTAIKGKIVLCFTTNNILPVEKLVQVALSVRLNGGRAFIYTQHSTDLLDICGAIAMGIPCVATSREISYQIYQYYSTSQSSEAKVSLTQTVIGSGVPAPKVAAFSSRGPSPLYPGVLKPDIAAPGVNILAAAAQLGSYKEFGASYYLNSGTSMSCPHVSGIVALLKSLHPDWSPAALKSALMTTALVTDNNGLPLLADGTPTKIADPFDYGAGFVNPVQASDPGLIYDIDPSDYQKLFNCTGGSDIIDSSCPTIERSLMDLNLPSITIPNLKTSETVSRTVTNVGQPDAVYKALFEPPTGVDMSVEPPMLVFGKKMSRSFKVTFKATRKIHGDYSFGNLVWHDGGSHWVRIPIAVRVVIQNSYSTVF
ncbi:subtilisin-like protease SBT3.5 [Phragmites australis]|uniref:subtilisin-like protease SBT3.5 n=1 Tax=Phragmites australis TaxID=29695 RepID=UPI002D769EC3|nr:subtilisin-like protease SBT3.5 [Phragmites australis]